MEVYLGLSGQTYNVGDALSDEAIGAEGSICKIDGNAMLVAKIYHDDIAESESKELENKLKLMINKKIVETQGVFSIAWPRDLLYKIVNGKRIFAGYTMRKVSASYNLSDLTHHNPDDPDPDPNGIDGYITWREFIQAAYNLSRLVEYLHKNGIEIGDFNERNFLFDEKTGGFDLIDCGTYGLFDTKTLKTIYPCRYSMPKYSAPEKLLGLDISDPKSTDCFYLAIHVFHLLMQNSEPFGYKENSDGNPISKLQEHISNGDCLYVKSIPGKTLRKHSIKPGVLPDDILRAFNRTFNYTRDNLSTRIKDRTTASEWCKVLEPYLIDDSRIKKCTVKIEHVYSSHLKECPWCNPSSVSDKPYELRVNTESRTTQVEGIRHRGIGPNVPCSSGSGKKYKDCHGKNEESTTNAASTTSSKLAEHCDILAGQMRSGDEYSISEPINEKNVLITLNGIKRVESFFQIDNINDPANEQIEKGIREAICRKERKQKKSDEGAAEKVKTLIDAIGKVTYTEDCRKKISTARMAFSNLTVPQRTLVPIDKLSKAEAEYERIKKAEDGNKKKRTVGIVAAALVACVVVIALFITGILHFGKDPESSSKSIHYYNMDLTDSLFFGPSCWNILSTKESLKKEFYYRIEHDPVMAAACIAHLDKTTGTRYLAEYYSENDEYSWINGINLAAQAFIDNDDVWKETVYGFKAFVDTADQILLEDASARTIHTLFMQTGEEDRPMIISGDSEWTEGITHHYLTFVFSIKNTEFKISYLIEEGFSPILE